MNQLLQSQTDFFRDILDKPVDGMSDPVACIMRQEAEAFFFGFYWESLQQILEQIQSECDEVKSAISKAHEREEMADVLHVALSLCLFRGYDPRDLMTQSYEKFQKRYDHVVDLAKKRGLSHLNDLTMEEKLALWESAKNQVALSSP